MQNITHSFFSPVDEVLDFVVKPVHELAQRLQILFAQFNIRASVEHVLNFHQFLVHGAELVDDFVFCETIFVFVYLFPHGFALFC